MNDLSVAEQLSIAVPTALVSVGILFRYSKKPRYAVRDSVKRVRHAIGVLVGYPEVRDPSDSKIIRQAIPGIGQRMDKLETTVGDLNIHLVQEARDHAERAAVDAERARVAANHARDDASVSSLRFQEMRTELDEVRTVIGLPVIARSRWNNPNGVRAAEPDESKESQP